MVSALVYLSRDPAFKSYPTSLKTSTLDSAESVNTENTLVSNKMALYVGRVAYLIVCRIYTVRSP